MNRPLKEIRQLGSIETLRCGLVSLASTTVHTTSKEKAITTVYKILALMDHLNSHMVVSLEVHAMAPMTWNWMLINRRLFILAVLILAIATSIAAQTVWSMVSILCEVSYVTSMLQLYKMSLTMFSLFLAVLRHIYLNAWDIFWNFFYLVMMLLYVYHLLKSIWITCHYSNHVKFYLYVGHFHFALGKHIKGTGELVNC